MTITLATRLCASSMCTPDKHDKELLSKRPMPDIDGCHLSHVDVYFRWKGLHNLPRSSSAQKARYKLDICNLRSKQQTNTKYKKKRQTRNVKDKSKKVAQGWVGSPEKFRRLHRWRWRSCRRGDRRWWCYLDNLESCCWSCWCCCSHWLERDMCIVCVDQTVN